MDFVKVFGHDTAGGLFSSQEEALSSNPATPSAALYSAWTRWRATGAGTAGSGCGSATPS